MDQMYTTGRSLFLVAKINVKIYNKIMQI